MVAVVQRVEDHGSAMRGTLGWLLDGRVQGSLESSTTERTVEAIEIQSHIYPWIKNRKNI